jgi:hypothetical protein
VYSPIIHQAILKNSLRNDCGTLSDGWHGRAEGEDENHSIIKEGEPSRRGCGHPSEEKGFKSP